MITELTIKRSEWLRGEGVIDSALLRKSDQKRCCVGIYGRALGVSDTTLEGKGWPNMRGYMDHGFIWDVKGTEAEWLVADEDKTRRYLSTFNDIPLHSNICATSPVDSRKHVKSITSEAQREEFIAAIFKANGVTITFED